MMQTHRETLKGGRAASRRIAQAEEPVCKIRVARLVGIGGTEKTASAEEEVTGVRKAEKTRSLRDLRSFSQSFGQSPQAAMPRAAQESAHIAQKRDMWSNSHSQGASKTMAESKGKTCRGEQEKGVGALDMYWGWSHGGGN